MSNRINIDKDWKFFLGDLSPRTVTEGWGGAKAKAFNFGATAVNLDDGKWRSINLPHDFVMEGDFTKNKSADNDMRSIPEMESINSRHLAGGSLEGGIAWYRKKFITDENCAGKRVYLHFGGIFRNSTVYINEYYVGTHTGGYSSFYYDITDFIHIGGENTVAVRVDATGREGWWYEGGGIYRHVWLEITDNIHAVPWGVYIYSEVDLNRRSAVLNISTELENKNLTSADVTVKSSIVDADGKVLAVSEKTTAVGEWGSAALNDRIELPDVILWDIDNPYLYTLKTELIADGKIKDLTETTFGIRHTRFDKDSGFYLNGRKVRVQGLCCHHDHAGIGIAANDSVQEYRIAQLKSMGANAYRSAHHMPTDELLDICDRMGMLVFDETRRMSSTAEDIEALRTMVRHGRNHPCVFLWGIGNEEIFSQDRIETERTTVTMKMEVRKLDKTRPVTSAVVCWNGVERFDTAKGHVHVTKNLDVMGFNYCRYAWDDYHERMPEQPVIITESASNSSTRGCYCTDESRGFYYIHDKDNETKCKSEKKALKKDIAESEWKHFAEREYLAGTFLWTGIDYRGEPTPLAYPAVYSQFGILDYCGFEKDNFYYYKSWWQSEDVLYIFPHWNFEAGEVFDVHCYSNLDEVELFVNEKSCGRQTMEKNWYLTWENVVYEPGEAKAVGYKNGTAVKEYTVTTTGAAAEIALDAYKRDIYVGDTAIVNVTIRDKDGKAVPTADNELVFEVTGSGSFLGCGNGNPGSHESDKIPVRRAFNGKCQLLVNADSVGTVTVKAASHGLISGIIEINVR